MLDNLCFRFGLRTEDVGTKTAIEVHATGAKPEYVT